MKQIATRSLIHPECSPYPVDPSGMQPISAQKKHADAVAIIQMIENFDSDTALVSMSELLKYNLDPADRENLRKALNLLEDYDFDGAAEALRAL